MRKVNANQLTRANWRWICLYLVKEQGEVCIADEMAAQGNGKVISKAKWNSTWVIFTTSFLQENQQWEQSYKTEISEFVSKVVLSICPKNSPQREPIMMTLVMTSSDCCSRNKAEMKKNFILYIKISIIRNTYLCSYLVILFKYMLESFIKYRWSYCLSLLISMFMAVFFSNVVGYFVCLFWPVLSLHFFMGFL